MIRVRYGGEEQSFQALSSYVISISRNLHGFSCQTLNPVFLGFMEVSLQRHDLVNRILSLSRCPSMVNSIAYKKIAL
jgi:hypothetical protein